YLHDLDFTSGPVRRPSGPLPGVSREARQPATDPGNPGDEPMTKALEQLEELVRRAEAEARSQKLEVEVQQAPTRLREAASKAQDADRRLRGGRPALVRILEGSEAEKKRLDQITRQMARLRLTQGEELVIQAGREIEQKRTASRSEVE